MKEAGTEFFDPVHLRTEEYADAGKFRARTGIYRYQQPEIDFGDWALSQLPDDLGIVLDVGCGPGTYVRKLSDSKHAPFLVGVDLSEGILGEVGEVDVNLCVGDAQALPFENHSFDTTLCMHMLYHVPEIDLAIGELRRITKQSGTVLVATNGSAHHREIRDAFDTAVAELTGKEVEPVLSSARRFRLEDGEEMLRRHFSSVERHDLPRELVLPEVAPIVSYLDGVRSFHESKLPQGVSWGDAVERFCHRVREEINRKGVFRSSIYAGVFICR